MSGHTNHSELLALLALAYQAGRCDASDEPWSCSDPATAELLDEARTEVELADAFALVNSSELVLGRRSPAALLGHDALRSGVIYREGWFCSAQGPVLVTCRAGQWWAMHIAYDPTAPDVLPQGGGLSVREEPLTPERYRALAVLFYRGDARRQ